MIKASGYLFLVLLSLSLTNSTAVAQDRVVDVGAECSSNAAASAIREGFRYSDKGDHEKALAAYKRAIQSDPTCAATYNNLGTAYYRLERHEEAIAAYQQALRLNPNWAWIYNYNLGRSYASLGRFEEAIKAYSETIRLKPREESAYRARSGLYLRLARGDSAAADAQAFLKLKGWRDERSPYAALLAHFGYRQAHRDEDARRILDETPKGKKFDWPYPVIRYLRQEITEQELLALATDTDKMTEARTYIGMNLSLSDKKKEALVHLQWVKEKGTRNFFEYKLALSELERINQRPSESVVPRAMDHNGVGPGEGAGFGTGRGHNTGDGKTGNPGPGGGVTDYTKTFKANEVTRKAVLLSKPEPGLTEEARKNNVTGVVKLRLVLGAGGSVSNISVVEGLPDGLTERAIAAARRISFTPAQKDGRPVSQWITIEYNFNAY